MKLLKTLRAHWKKSIFGFSSLTYGTYYLVERKHTQELLQAYCYEALKYSQDKVSPEQSLKRVTIFLNPIANQERGRFLYEKNVAPLLHLAGLDVRLIRLDKNSEANEYMKEIDMNDTDCIVVAGGNATLNEVISGLISRPDASEFLRRISIGVIPIGETNKFAEKWLENFGPKRSKEKELRFLADSAMSIITGLTKPIDLLQVTLNRPLNLDKPDETNNELGKLDVKKTGAYSLLKEKKIYALSNISFGFVTEIDANIDKYWYYGWLKSRMNEYFMRRFLRISPLKYELKYKLQCNGCSKCLNEHDLRNALETLINKSSANSPKTNSSSLVNRDLKESRSSMIQLFYNLFFKIGSIKLKETPEQLETKLKQVRLLNTLIEKSKQINENCNKVYEATLMQTHLIARVNESSEYSKEEQASFEEGKSEKSYIDVAIVKDPEYNLKDMFLAERKEYKEFQVRKLTNATEKKFPEERENEFRIEIDGEIYKLDNKHNDLAIRIEHLEKCINFLRPDPNLCKNIKSNSESKLYLKKMRLEMEKNSKNINFPTIRPFENLYLSYWNYK
jgi:diacylglycerol kinase family enzyme